MLLPMLAILVPAAEAAQSSLACASRRRLLCALAALAAVGPFAAVEPASGARVDHGRMRTLARERYGQQAADMVDAWAQLLGELGGLGAMDQLNRVNGFFNRRIRFVDDIDIWRKADYWATPLETMGRGAGDCEDFTIAKYMTMRLAGMSNSHLRLIYVRARIGRVDSGLSQAHMVLGYYPEATDEPMILDNLVTDIRPASRRPDLTPVFSFNSEGLWVGGASTSSADPTARLSRWRSVLQRMQDQGFH